MRGPAGPRRPKKTFLTCCRRRLVISGWRMVCFRFRKLHFQVPGTEVNLTGTYTLDGNQFEFHGKARMRAKLSHMVTGWRSALLKPVDPFFSKHGAGTEVPVKVTVVPNLRTRSTRFPFATRLRRDRLCSR